MIDMDKPTPAGTMMAPDGRVRTLVAIPLVICPEDLAISVKASVREMTEAVFARARRQVENDLSNTLAENKKLRTQVAELQAEIAALKKENP
jgi:uncharacterized protein YlxW (UPF0749 family)